MGFYRQVDWKQPSYEGLCPTAIEWAQMAAYIDGEGSILINTQKTNPGRATDASGFYLRVTVANTDVRLPVWCVEHFGGKYADANTAKYYEGKNWKRAYHWGCGSTRAAWVLHNCLPYFVIKQEQAQIGIDLQTSLVQPKGRVLPQEIVEKRRVLKSRLLVLKSKGIKGIPVPSGPVVKTA